MPTAYDVPPDLLIARIAERIRQEVPEVKPPEWAGFVKTSSGRERPPGDRDWWYMRCASLLRKLYVHGPLSVKDLRSTYGGRSKKYVHPPHHVTAGSSIIRRALHQLEEAGLVEKTPRGRALTARGKGFVDSAAAEVFEEMVKRNPELARLAGAGEVER